MEFSLDSLSPTSPLVHSRAYSSQHNTSQHITSHHITSHQWLATSFFHIDASEDEGRRCNWDIIKISISNITNILGCSIKMIIEEVCELPSLLTQILNQHPHKHCTQPVDSVASPQCWWYDFWIIVNIMCIYIMESHNKL